MSNNSSHKIQINWGRKKTKRDGNQESLLVNIYEDTVEQALKKFEELKEKLNENSFKEEGEPFPDKLNSSNKENPENALEPLKLCPKCERHMVKRKSSKGNWYWKCTSGKAGHYELID